MELTNRTRPDYAVVIDLESPEATKLMEGEFSRIQQEIGKIEAGNVACMMAIFVSRPDPQSENKKHKVQIYHMGSLSDSVNMFQTLIKTMKQQAEQSADAMNSTKEPPQ